MNTNDMQSAESSVLPEGSRVRVTALSVSGNADIDLGSGRPGHEYDVCSYAAPNQGDDPKGLAYYLLDTEGSYGGSHWAYPEHVEVVMTLEAKQARKPPSLSEIRRAASSALIGIYEPIEAYAVDHEGDDALRVYGTTSEGLSVAFRVRIDQIEEVS